MCRSAVVKRIASWPLDVNVTCPNPQSGFYLLTNDHLVATVFFLKYYAFVLGYLEEVED